MTKEQRWVTFCAAAMSFGRSASEAACCADGAEEAFSKRFPSGKSLMDRARDLAAERACTKVLTVEKQQLVELVVEALAPDLGPGAHIEFALTDSPVHVGIGASGEVVASGGER